MVDPGIQGQLDRGIGGVLVDLGQGGRAVDQDRAPMAKATKPALLHGTHSLFGRQSRTPLRQWSAPIRQ
jgi:hypothetical protein